MKKLLHSGYLAPLFFWCMTIVGGFVHGNYNHLRDSISELGAMGTRSESFTTISLIILTILCLLFSISFFRVSKKLKLSILPSVLSFGMPMAIFWAAIFPSGHDLHATASPLAFFTILGFLLTYFLWRKNKLFAKVATISLFCFFISTLIFLRFLQPFGNDYEGLIQRFFYLAWTIRTVSIASSLIKNSL